MLKVGGILLCKKNFSYSGGHNGVNFFNGKYYYVKSSPNKNGDILMIDDNLNTWWFNIIKRIPPRDFLFEHFYSSQEIRKLKLKQINDTTKRR